MKSTYKCKKCDEVYYERFDFMEHQNTHTKETPFMCINCRKCFSLVIDYVNHINSQHFSESCVCEFNSDNCSTCEIKKQNISKYVNDRQVTVTKKCLKCSNVFDNNQDLKNHLKICIKNSFKLGCHCCSCQIESQKQNSLEKPSQSHKCGNCNKKFSTSEKLSKHACFILSPGESFRCSCSQSFTEISAFKNHIGNKPYTCCTCTMQFNTITNLVRHVRTHTKQKPYICKDCGRGFSQSANLRNHMSVHLGIRAVKCNECNFSCKTYNGLLKHKKKHEEGAFSPENYVDGRKNSVNKSICPVCNKQFLFKRNMGMHMKIHNNKVSLCTECGKVFDSRSKLTSHYKACHREPSVCKTCGKVFASAVLLGAHEKIHVNVKSFSCNVCQKTFAIKNYLSQHMKTHSNKKQYSCSKCGKLFKVAVSLKYHSNICTSLTLPV